MPFYHVEVTDSLNRKAKIRIEQRWSGLDPVWKSLTVGRFRVPVGICQDYQTIEPDSLLLLHDDGDGYGYQKLGQFNIVLLHDFWMTKHHRINDLGNAFLYEGANGMEYGMAMWKKVPQ